MEGITEEEFFTQMEKFEAHLAECKKEQNFDKALAELEKLGDEVDVFLNSIPSKMAETSKIFDRGEKLLDKMLVTVVGMLHSAAGFPQ